MKFWTARRTWCVSQSKSVLVRSIELMRDIRPDVRVLLANAETFGFEAPSPMLRSLADRETACHIEASMSQGELPSAEFVAASGRAAGSSGRHGVGGMPSRRAVTPKRRSFWRVRRWLVATPMPSGCSSVRMRQRTTDGGDGADCPQLRRGGRRVSAVRAVSLGRG